jgi:hypothetical protein
MIREYLHEPLNQKVDAISGHYVFTKEGRLSYQNREILYLVGYAVIDTSCCGAGGCGFAWVPGYIVSWKSKVNAEGLPISQVEPIEDPEVRKETGDIIQKQEPVNQVQFWKQNIIPGPHG